MFKREDLIQPCANCNKTVTAYTAIIMTDFEIWVYFYCENCTRGWKHTITCDVLITAPR